MRPTRIILLSILLIAIIVAFSFLLGTEVGRQFVQHPRQHGREIQTWVANHRWIAPIAFLAIYLVLSILALPVWWIQVLAGWGFGLIPGVIWTQVGGTLGAGLTVQLAHWLAGDEIRQRVEARRIALKKLDDRLGHNGLLVVMLIRLTHFMPFGLSNYAFGLTRITAREAAAGTLLGGIPAAIFYVALGSQIRLLGNWRYLLILAAINCLLLVPLVLRYLRPQWFRRIGIE